MDNFLHSYKYKYIGQERQDELGLNTTAMDFRQYDPAIGRFNGMDRLTELVPSMSPYRFGFNNPVYWSDPTGLFENSNALTDYYDKDGVVYFDPKVGPDNLPSGATYIGPTYYNPETGTFWDENGTPHSNETQLSEVVVTSSNSKTSDPLFWINTGLGFSSTYTGFKANFHIRNELWHLSNNGTFHNVFEKSWKKSKYKNVRAHQAQKVQLPRNISNGLAATSLVMTGVNVYKTGELKASDVLYASMAGISFTGVGSVVAGVFFVADLATMGTSYLLSGEANSIGDYLDENTNGGVILNKNDFGYD